MSVPAKISELVERFQQNASEYRSTTYNETQAKNDFIDPFFEALGWDIRNKKRSSEAYREVIYEYSVKIGDTHKAPDYCFRIGKDPKFFVEAKKPSVNIAQNTKPAFQLRRYGWSASLPVSILTDFEEFAVYDCRIQPNVKDNPIVARILYFKYTEYIDKWDEIVSLFSREAVLAGSLNQFITSQKVEKGNLTVDAAFLNEIEHWRNILANNIVFYNPEISDRDLNFAVQITINRIIFLRICEDRGTEPYGRLEDLQKGSNVYNHLCQIFREADDRYNSGLFHFKAERDRRDFDNFTLSLTIGDIPLKNIIKNLYYPSPYEFSVIPIEIIGQVYEQFLGKIITLSSVGVIVEDKPEVRKAGGVYYTPTYIVDYIVKNTVGKLLAGKTAKQAAKLKILDPSCGSGSFLIGVYQYLLEWYRDYYQEYQLKNPNRKVPIYESMSGWQLTSTEKKKILLDNIFGVDIDSQAVEVSKLSLLLKVLEGESQESVANQLRLFKERALPDLDNNIKCGNSLIASDFYDNIQMGLLSEDEVYRINVFDWDQEFSETMRSGGFDAIIGNPPYGAEFIKSSYSYLKDNYQTYILRGESYLVFIEKAINSLKIGGKLSYIVPDTYLNLGFTEVLRKFLLQNSRIREIVSLPSNVFSGAVVDTTLLFTEKYSLTNAFYNTDVLVRVIDKKSSITSIDQVNREFIVSTKIWNKINSFNIHSDKLELEILLKIETNNKLLSSYAEVFSGIKAYEVGQGIPPQTEKIRNAKPFTSKTKLNNSWQPFYNGRHIGRYELLWKQDNWLDYGCWLAAQRNPKHFEGEKILIRKIVSHKLVATYIPDTSYCNTLVFIAKLKSKSEIKYFYLLGILNSHFVGWYFRKKFQITVDDTFPQIMRRDILQIPIPRSNPKNSDRMVSLVEQIMSLHNKLKAVNSPNEKKIIQKQIEVTDRQIDQLVYLLYELTDAEIVIVENIS